MVIDMVIGQAVKALNKLSGDLSVIDSRELSRYPQCAAMVGYAASRVAQKTDRSEAQAEIYWLAEHLQSLSRGYDVYAFVSSILNGIGDDIM